MADNDNERLMVFSDAVITITVTLLVLDVRIPGEIADLTDEQLWAAVLSIWPRIFAYVLSFAVIAVYWFSHRRRFEVISRRSVVLDWLNMLYLLTIGFIPFVTSVIAENGGAVATAFYAAVVCLTSVVGTIICIYAEQAGLATHAEVLHHSRNGSLVTAAVFLASIPVAFLDPTAGKLFWILILPAGRIVQLIETHRPHRHQPRP